MATAITIAKEDAGGAQMTGPPTKKKQANHGAKKQVETAGNKAVLKK